MRKDRKPEKDASENREKRIYISGPVTGTKGYQKRFRKAAKLLKAAGFTPVNPVRMTEQMNPAKFSHADYMTICMAAITLCDGIYMLEGYRQSRGAREELDYALKNGMTVIFQEPVDGEEEYT